MKARELISHIYVERFDCPLGSKIFALSTIQSVDECPRVFIRTKDYLFTRPNEIVHFEDCVFKISDFDRVAYIWYIWLIIIWSGLRRKWNVLITRFPYDSLPVNVSASFCWDILYYFVLFFIVYVNICEIYLNPPLKDIYTNNVGTIVTDTIFF